MLVAAAAAGKICGSTLGPTAIGPFLILDTLDSDTDPRIGVAFYWDREILLNNIDLDASSKS